MFAAIGRAVVRRPWLVIIGWLVAAAAIMILRSQPEFGTNSDQASFLPGRQGVGARRGPGR